MTLLLSFPLLARQLTETAVRRRTYVMRVIYAALVFIPFGFFYAHLAPANRGGWLGVGSDLFIVSTELQMAGIYIFLPALMCGAIAQEKERHSLALLLITTMTPAEIISQKFLGGLVQMFSFLALSLPMAAACYSLGGLQIQDLFMGALFLGLTALHVGAIALLASVLCRTTPQAYALTCLLAYPAPVLALAFCPSGKGFMSWLWLSSPFVPALGWLELARAWQFHSLEVLALYVLPSLAVIAAFLFCAHELLTIRAFVPPNPWLRQAFGRLDGWMLRTNRAASGTAFSHGKQFRLFGNPIEWWREVRHILTLPGHPLRIAVLMECISVPIGLLTAAFQFGSEATMLHLNALLALFGVAAALAAMVLGANALVSERVQQTLDVLLSTPLSAAQMMCQKASVMHRFVMAGLLPAGSLVALVAWSQAAHFRNHPHEWQQTWLFAIAAMLSFLIDLPLIWWLSLWLSAESGTRLPAMVRAITGVAVFLALPSVVLALATQFIGHDLSALVTGAVIFVSPLEVLRMAAGDGTRSIFGDGWPLVLPAHLMVCGALLCVVQQRCLRRAEHYLRG